MARSTALSSIGPEHNSRNGRDCVKRCRADVVLAAEIRSLHACLMLFQNSKYLLLAEPCFLHASFPFLAPRPPGNSSLSWHCYRGKGHKDANYKSVCDR